MKVIGITGGIGTGKSTILHILEQNDNTYIVETDRLAHELMKKGQAAYVQIVDAFGDDILDASKEIDRAKLGKIVFQNEEKLACLNAIVHPVVKQYILNDICKKKEDGNVLFYIIEAALLIEDGYKEICDVLWGVQTEFEVRISRLLKGRGGTRQKWVDVINNQSPEEFYRNNCDAIIDNNLNLDETKEQIKTLLKTF